MKLTLSQPDPAGPLHLAGEVDVYGATALHEALARHVRTAASVELDLSGVTGCDPVGVQLLCSARRSAEAAAKPFRIVRISEPFARVCAALGLASDQLALS